MSFITKGRTNWKFILIIIVLAAVVGGVIFIYQYFWLPEIPTEKYCEKDEDCACGVHKTTRDCFYGNKNYVDTTQQCPDFCTGIAANFEIKCINKECKQINMIEDETANWQTYRNDEYGFEFKYPNFYTQLDECSENLATTCLVGLKHLNANATISIWFIDKNFNLQDIKLQFAPTGNENPPEQVITGQNIFYFYGPGGGGVSYPDYYFYNLNSRILIIAFNGPYINDKTPSQETKQLETKMLSTFRFIETTGGFCGSSTHGSCSSDLDCITGGCSGQVCQSKNEEPLATTCEWIECYDDTKYGITCGCVNNKCLWYKKNTKPSLCPEPPSCSVPLIYGDPSFNDPNQCPRYYCPAE